MAGEALKRRCLIDKCRLLLIEARFGVDRGSTGGADGEPAKALEPHGVLLGTDDGGCVVFMPVSIDSL